MTIQTVNSNFEKTEIIEQVPEMPAKMPGYAHFIFHWALVNRTNIPDPLGARAWEVIASCTEISYQDPNDAENLLLLSLAYEILGGDEVSIEFYQEAQNCEINISEEQANRLTSQNLRQKASLFMEAAFLAEDRGQAQEVYKDAENLIVQLFNSPGERATEDFCLRAAFDIHSAIAAGEDWLSVVQHYMAAIDDLESARSMDPSVIEACLKSVRKKLILAEKNLRSQLLFQEKVLDRLYKSDAPLMRRAIVRIDLASGFSPDQPMGLSLSKWETKVRNKLSDKILTIGILEKGPTPFITLKVMQANINVRSFLDRTGLFTSRTYLTIVPGENLLSRSQSSLLYAISCHGPLGDLWAKRLDGGVCFGGAASWLTKVMNGQAQQYFDGLDKAVLHIWDNDVKNLFRNIMLYQFANDRDVDIQTRSNLRLLQICDLKYDAQHIMQYLSQLPQHTVGFLCIRGEIKRHIIAGIINPLDENGKRTKTFSLFYDFNDDIGDLNVGSIAGLSDEIISSLSNPLLGSGPVTFYLYQLPGTPRPELLPESHWGV